MSQAQELELIYGALAEIADELKKIRKTLEELRDLENHYCKVFDEKVGWSSG